jgi:signal transduction histidine kinase
LVKVFAQRVGGAVHIRSAPGEGTEVILKMPRVPLSAQGAL